MRSQTPLPTRAPHCAFTATARAIPTRATPAPESPCTAGVVLEQLWYGLYHPNGTNNTAELKALHHALLMAEQAILAGEGVEVLSDSTYAIKCISVWASSWEKKGWTKAGGPIRNLELIQLSYELYNRIKVEARLTHVSAHVGTEGNELADRMAMLAVQSKQKELRQYEGELDVESILKMRSG